MPRESPYDQGMVGPNLDLQRKVAWAGLGGPALSLLMWGASGLGWVPPHFAYWFALIVGGLGALIFGGLWLHIGWAWASERWRVQWPITRASQKDGTTARHEPEAVKAAPPKYYSKADKERLAELYAVLEQFLVSHGATHRGDGVHSKFLRINHEWHPLVNHPEIRRMSLSPILKLCEEASAETSEVNRQIYGDLNIAHQPEYLRFSEEIKAVLGSDGQEKLAHLQTALNRFMRVVRSLEEAIKLGSMRLFEEIHQIGRADIDGLWTTMGEYQQWLEAAFQRARAASSRLAE